LDIAELFVPPIKERRERMFLLQFLARERGAIGDLPAVGVDRTAHTSQANYDLHE